ncbi:MAG: MotA/TolQ/ExbB proton channel family protein [Treponema sp.]|jgi:biopolymer transport protein ExbB|nr:MotA/TolQ/ExbB proton channel family protein [Treponema sp.]
METSGFSLLELFRLGGVFMWPLLLFSVATIAIALERGVFIFYHNLSLDDLKEKLDEFLKQGKIKEAEDWLSALTKRRPGARVLLALLEKAVPHSGGKRSSEDAAVIERRLEKAAEAEAAKCINSLENGFNFLTALGSVSPLTGFLGTVSGMIGAFRSIAEAVDVNAQIVANGIYEALITTVFGLIIAIIAMVAHSLFTHIVDKFASNLEMLCSDIIIDLSESVPSLEKDNNEN